MAKTYTVKDLSDKYQWPVFDPKEDDVFFHYCSTETFRLICQSRSLRLTDINMMSDYGEVEYGRKILKAAGEEILKIPSKPKAYADFDQAFMDDVDRVYMALQDDLHPILCSLSQDPDVLSQWREYADRGAGVSIGISGAALKNMQMAMMRVDYAPNSQIKKMMSMLLALFAVEKDRGNARGDEFDTSAAMVASYALGFKNPAFAEEKEIRCTHFLSVNTKHGVKILEDEDGFEGAAGQPVKYLTRENGGIVVHIDMPFPQDPKIQPIKQVWLGPKNINSEKTVGYLLNSYGYSGYSTHRSSASYR